MVTFVTFLTATLALAGALGPAGPARADFGFAINFVVNPYAAGVGDSWLFGINNRGQATGYTATTVGGNFVQAPVIYQVNGAIQNLAPAAPYSFPLSGNAGSAINNRGDVAGSTGGQPTYFAAGGVNTPIVLPADLFGTGGPTPGVSAVTGSSVVRGLNDSGTVLLNVGPGNFPDPSPFSERYGLWNSGTFTTLTALDGFFPFASTPDTFTLGYSESVTGLNSANQFAATVVRGTFDFDFNETTAPSQSSFYYDGTTGTYSLLQALVSGDALEMLSMSDDGSALGWSDNRLVTWNPDGTIRSVLPVPGFALRRFGSFGYGSAYRNNLGEVAAVTRAGGAAIYSPATNSWRNITPDIAGLGTGRIQNIQGFNDHQQFVGLATPPGGGGTFGYMVSPTPLPPTVLGAGVVALALLAARRRRRGTAAEFPAVAG